MIDYEIELQKQQENKNSSSAAEDVIKFYHNNLAYCTKAYEYYREYEKDRNSILDFKDISAQEFKKNLGTNPILIVTSNPIEEAILLHSLFDKVKNKIKCFFIEEYAYQIVKIKKYTIVHVHTKTTGEESARLAINTVTKIFSPVYVFLLGVCYGFDYKNFTLGTTIIANKVLGLHVDYRDSNYDFVTDFDERADEKIIEKLEKRLNYFQPPNELLNDSINTKAKTGIIISINSLVSNGAFKNELLSAYKIKPLPLGGEMEANGLFKTDWFKNQGKNKWLIIKSMCDWGESKNLPGVDEKEKEIIKNSIQALAMSYTWVIFELIIERKMI